MTAVDERCGVLGGIILLGLCCCQWGRGEWPLDPLRRPKHVVIIYQ